jgi:feruloyl esterase
MSGFRGRGGKLIMYTGWADPHNVLGTLHYYEQMAKFWGMKRGECGGHEKSWKKKKTGKSDMQNWFRFFTVPGMYHCSGGPGPNVFDMLTPLENWVEHGIAPNRIIASHFTGGVVDRTRPLCPYPMVARWNGSGSINEAENFNCVPPDYEVPVNDWDDIIRFPWE